MPETDLSERFMRTKREHGKSGLHWPSKRGSRLKRVTPDSPWWMMYSLKPVGCFGDMASISFY